MTRPSLLRTTEAYSFALAPVIGPFFEALGHLAANLGHAHTQLHLPEAELLEHDDQNLT
jgi:hypothetical protein